MFAFEKRIALDLAEVDILAGDNRREPYLSINPMGSTPALLLPSGQIISEILPICEYLEEQAPEPALVGSNAEGRAHVRMWARRIDLNFVAPMVSGFRADEGRALFEPRVPLVRQDAAADLKAIAADWLGWLDANWADRIFVAGANFSLADILLFCFLDFAKAVGISLMEDRPRLVDWFERMSLRDSAAA